ncbi:MAG: type II toxin-antitoxin system HicB family antitoxin [Lachnospiraceae bacterium]|nr:type II toxin-antitoxin system HicB family antitoxin [Lachnospiraceae bacterium]
MKKKTIDYYMSLPYRLEIIPDTEEGGYTAYYPELAGCITCAETMEEVVGLAQDAKRCWFTACIEDGISIPEPTLQSDISRFSGQFKIRMPKSLHRTLSQHAKAEGISMNQYCIYLLSKNDAIYAK